MRETDVLVQPILVRKTGLSHEEAVWRAATESVRILDTDSGVTAERLAAWRSRGMRKNVRRASATALAGVVEAGEHMWYGDGVVLAGPVLTYGEYPDSLNKMQVSGTEFERLGVSFVSDSDIYIRVLDTLSTGKAAAAAAHAAWAFAAESFRDGVSVTFCDAGELAVAEQEGGKGIWDAGHTEVSSGTLTAVAVKLM